MGKITYNIFALKGDLNVADFFDQEDIKFNYLDNIEFCYKNNAILLTDNINIGFLDKLYKNKQTRNIIIYVFTNERYFTSSVFLYYAKKNIFVFSNEIFKQIAFNDSNFKSINIDKYFYDLDKKYQKVISLSKKETDLNQMVSIFVNGTIDYHYFLMNITNTFLKDIMKNSLLSPYISILLLKENGQYKIFGNIGELLVKKEYESIPLDEGFLKLDNFDFYLMRENSFEHTPEYEYVIKLPFFDDFIFLILYFLKPPFLTLQKIDYLKEQLKNFKQFLINFGYKENSEKTIINRYIILNHRFEKKILKNNHSKNVAKITHLIVNKLQLSKKEKNLLENAALFHDLGKIFMLESDNIYLHQTISALIVQKIPFLKILAPIINNHHLIGENFTKYNQILFLADYIENILRTKAAINIDFLKEKKVDSALIKILTSDFLKTIKEQIKL